MIYEMNISFVLFFLLLASCSNKMTTVKTLLLTLVMLLASCSNKMTTIKTLLLALAMLLASCSNKVATVHPPEVLTNEQLLQTHRKLLLDQQIEIEAFINRNEWSDMERTESGLYILRTARETATRTETINYGDTIQLQLNIRILNGIEIFNGIQDTQKTQKIITGKTEITAGLREALLKMHYGENAYLIVPSHLAYGFSGNGENIPANATLLYELQIKNK
jgi:FKBP-type peptidyl-prolyl cis-trans isomerase